MTRTLRIAVADDEPEVREYLKDVLPRLGHQVVSVAANGKQLLEQCRAQDPDVVITGTRLPELDGIAAAAALNRERPIPVILVSAPDETERIEWAGLDHVMAYLIKPVREADLKAALVLAVRRFGQFQALAREAADLRQALEDRKTIERAKGAVMKRTGVGEQEAFRRLQKLASDSNRKLVQLAEEVLASEGVFQQLEQCDKGPP